MKSTEVRAGERAMSPERWRQIEKLFGEAVALEPARRAGFVALACGTDAGLADEVNRLIRNASREDDFLESPVWERTEEEVVPETPARIGPYDVIRPIGRGGMGEVYLASRADDEYRKEVAIKLIRTGLDTGSIIRRFRKERQILANLEHPNIARLLDGGTTEAGLPYLVMELIEGRPITEYCEAHRLSLAQRLRLFREVCEAVHYAHQRLVVHLDIKPANILVADGATGGPAVPKLLDFGIARLLTPDSGAAGPGDTTLLRPLTPDYASPEQVRGEAPTVASDIYSLGVLLYELLSGDRPHRLAGLLPHDAVRIVSDTEPARPSAALSRRLSGKAGTRASRQIAGDLDSIALMALRTDPRRRYASVAQLSEDIGRHLNGQPVAAARGTLRYLAVKFVRRHRTGTVAAALVLAALTAGLISTSWEAGIARSQRSRAERQLDEALKLTHSLLFDYQDALAGLNGATPVRHKLVQETIGYLDRLARDSRGSVPLRRQLATAYLKIGDVQGRPYTANLGDTAGALASYRQALTLLRTLSPDNSGDEELRAELSDAYDATGRLLTRTYDYPAAIGNLRQALDTRLELVHTHHDNADYRRKLASTWIALGDTLLYSGQFQAPLDAYTHAERLRAELFTARPGDLALRREWAVSRQRLGSAYADVAAVLFEAFADQADAEGVWRKGLAYYRSALETANALSASDPQNAELRRAVADSSADTARVLGRLGSLTEATDLQRRAVALFTGLLHADPANREAEFDLMAAERDLAEVLGKNGRTDEALRMYTESIAAAERLLRADPNNSEARNCVVGIYDQTSQLLESAGRLRSALQYTAKNLSLLEASAALFPRNPLWRELRFDSLLRMSRIQTESGRPAEAHAAAVRGVTLARRDADRDGATAEELLWFGGMLMNAPARDLRDFVKAASYLERGVKALPAATPRALADLAFAYYASGDRDRALKTVAKAAALLPGLPEIGDPAAVQRKLEATASAEWRRRLSDR